MIVLQGFSETGKKCPKCNNGSIFEHNKRKFLGLLYKETIIKCYMVDCDYEVSVDRRIGRIKI